MAAMFKRAPARIPEAAGGPQRASLTTLAGRTVTSATADIAGGHAGWTATLSALSRPGRVASLFFSEGVREVILRLADGRRAKARLRTTAFVGGERVCQLTGLEPLA
jgi:hypothetical protein